MARGQPIVTRFAPSPNGRLHLGHAYSALFAARFAARRGGRFLLRIEDIDHTRAREQFVQAIFDDLRWLGVRWEEPVWRQRERMAHYHAALTRLKEMGLLYPCFCTRRRMRAVIAGRPDWPRDPAGAPLYPGTCRHLPAAEREERLAAGDEHAWRLDMSEALRTAARLLHGKPVSWREEGVGPQGETGLVVADPAAFGDVVLGRKDIGVSYHVAVVIDDAAQGVSHVTRGHDLFAASAVHRLLQVLLGLPEPAYAHHRLITDAAGRKLAKRRASTALAELRAQGVTPEDVRRALALENAMPDDPQAQGP